MSIIGSIPTSRVSDAYTRQQLLTQLESDQSSLTKLQNELSSGQALALPSDDPSAALRGIAANSLVQQNTQIATNLSLSQSYLSESESVLSSASSLLSSVNSTGAERDRHDGHRLRPSPRPWTPSTRRSAN